MTYSDRNPSRLLHLPEVLDLTGLSRETIYECIVGGRFPKPVICNSAGAMWLCDDIDLWLAMIDEIED